MRAGVMRHIIAIERPAVVRDRFGANTKTWETVTDCLHTDVRERSTGIEIENGDLTFGYTVDFIVRYTSQIDERMRISWDGRYYRIKGIDRDALRRQLVIHTEIINE